MAALRSECRHSFVKWYRILLPRACCHFAGCEGAWSPATLDQSVHIVHFQDCCRCNRWEIVVPLVAVSVSKITAFGGLVRSVHVSRPVLHLVSLTSSIHLWRWWGDFAKLEISEVIWWMKLLGACSQVEQLAWSSWAGIFLWRPFHIWVPCKGLVKAVWCQGSQNIYLRNHSKPYCAGLAR